MSIFPAVDIVSDVAHAANPARARIAMNRLEAAAGSSFTRMDIAPMHSGGAGLRTNAVFSDRQPAAARRVEGNLESAPQKFEAFLLQSWLEILLPPADSGAFGHGQEGGVWRSLMAEQLGDQIARAGGIGLQGLLGRSYGTTEPQQGAQIQQEAGNGTPHA